LHLADRDKTEDSTLEEGINQDTAGVPFHRLMSSSRSLRPSGGQIKSRRSSVATDAARFAFIAACLVATSPAPKHLSKISQLVL